jgi:hypothetical protein
MEKKDLYSFPFEQIHSNTLIPGNTYYIRTSDASINAYTWRVSQSGPRTRGKKIEAAPIIRLKGTFVRMEDVMPNNYTRMRYLVFKNLVILDKSYEGIPYGDFFVKTDRGIVELNERFDANKKLVNNGGEVYLYQRHNWIFGSSNETTFVQNQVIRNLQSDARGVISGYAAIKARHTPSPRSRSRSRHTPRSSSRSRAGNIPENLGGRKSRKRNRK